MKNLKKIIIFSGITLIFMSAGLIIFPHRPLENISTLINNSIQVILFYTSLFIFLNEPTSRHRFLFFNFTLYFGIVYLLYLQQFIGVSIFPMQGSTPEYSFVNYVSVYSFQYINALMVYLQAFVITYLVFDLLFMDYKIYQKYAVTLVVTIVCFAYYFHPFLENPVYNESIEIKPYIYRTDDIQKYKIIENASIEFTDKYGYKPVAAELSTLINLKVRNNGIVVGELFPEENLRQIESLMPYLDGDNVKVLIMQPLFYNMIYMNVYVLLFILLYFGYQITKDPPQGAYIDKIMFIFLIIFALDAIHYWSYIKSIEFKGYSEIFKIGQYFTTIAFFALAVFFNLRLRFIKSVVGEFYEIEIENNPEKITRWLDGIDKFILKNFGNAKVFRGRLFEQKIN